MWDEKASTMTDKNSPGDNVELVTFELGGKRWGIGIEHVEEVLEVKAITPVPKVPSFILGIMNCRGKIVTVVDLAIIVGTKCTEEEKGEKRILRLKSEDTMVGLLVGAGVRIDSLGHNSFENKASSAQSAGCMAPIPEKRIALHGEGEVSFLDGNEIVDWLTHYRFT